MSAKKKARELPVIEEFDEISGKQENVLVLYNDDVHTFDYVIESLIEICEHTVEQAEQCTYLVHYKGKCEVKKGGVPYLRPMRRSLADKGLKATIE